MPRSIALTRTPQRYADQGYRVTYVAVGTDTPSEVFVMRRYPLDPTKPAGTLRDRYDHVATPAEIADLPVSAPLSGQYTFRTATIASVHATRDLADAEWESLQAAINLLVRALNAGDETLDPESAVLDGS